MKSLSLLLKSLLLVLSLALVLVASESGAAATHDGGSGQTTGPQAAQGRGPVAADSPRSSLTRDNHFIIERLPSWLLRPGPRNLLWWQWIALPLLLLVASTGGFIASFVTRAAIARIVKRTATHWDDHVLERLGGPLATAWTIAFAYLAIPLLGLYEPAERFLHQLLRGVLFADFFWALSRLIDLAGQIAKESSWARDRPASKALVPLACRVAKVVVVAMAVVALLSELGYPVASLIAGLGIGGVAVALAAQKTVENLFGAFSISADQPFREGDFVKVEDFLGTVEGIGLRSTRIRTLDRTLITVPNGKLAEMRLESFAARDRIRLVCTVGLVYGTSANQMRSVLEGLERLLREHAKIWPDAVIVRFKEFGDSSLNIEVMCWFITADWGEFQLIRQDVLLGFMEVVEGAGTSFAFPTRTVHVVSED